MFARRSFAAPPRRRLLRVSVAVVAALVLGFGVCEVLGWPFLATPMQRWLSSTLERRVSFASNSAIHPIGGSASDPSGESQGKTQVKIHLLGRIEIAAAQIEIGAPAWSRAPHMLRARDARLTLGYGDLWRASRGEPLRIRALRAAQLDGQMERLADGRASWQFAGKPVDPNAAPPRLPEFGQLEVGSGRMLWRDAVLDVEVDARFSLADGAQASPAGASASAAKAASGPPPVTAPAPAPAPAPVHAPAPASAASAPGLQLSARGSYQKMPLSVDIRTAGVLPALGENAATLALPVTLNAVIGRARITFNGSATDVLRMTALQGRFSVQGPSLAAVGDPLHITLPTTAPFRAEGALAKQGVVWNAVLDRVSLGASRLAGAFTFDPRPRVPLLSGRLSGARLALADLGPTVGTPVTVAAPGAAAPVKVKATSGRSLPDREFDLPALRAMDANVLIAIDSVDLGTQLLEPLRPLRAHLILSDGVLMLRDFDARTGQGNLRGQVQLDGRTELALWQADLRWNGVRLERWIQQQRANHAPPYVSGSLAGQARVAGQGKSTAAILGSLSGGVRMQVTNGTVSHLVVEAAGLDIAQSLGVLIKGDDALPVLCSVADLVAEKGVLRPRALVVDTSDSTLWVDGTVSLLTEALDLRVVVSPKDFSPLALRAPIHLRGTFADPSVELDKPNLAKRLGAAAVLALINPLAAVIPLMDFSDGADAQNCRTMSARIARAIALPAPKLVR